MINYDSLWNLIYERHITRSKLCEDCGISRVTMVRMKKNEPVSLDVIDRICETLNCDIADIISYKNQKKT